MVKQDALMESLSSNLHGFLKQIGANLRVPQKKFLRDGLVGLVRAGHPIICQMGREIPNQRSTYTSRVKRLDLHLTAETDFVARSPGNDVPFMLLTTLSVETPADAKRVLRYYIRRWECEEGIQFLKEQVNLEATRTFRWTAICRLILLAMLVMLYLSRLWENHLTLAERLIDYAQVLPHPVDFMFYRLLTGLMHVLNACFYLRKDLL